MPLDGLLCLHGITQGKEMKLKRYITEKKAAMTGDQYKDHFLKQLNKWDSDLSKLTKAYKTLKADPYEKADPKEVKKFIMLKKAFITFSNNFEKWVYKSILDNAKIKKESYFQKEVRTTAWTFLRTGLYDYEMFPSSYDYDNNKHYPNPNALLERDKKKYITRYQRFWRKFKEAFIELVEYEAEKIDEVRPDEIINVSGINIVIKNRTKDYGDEYVKNFMKHVKRVTQLMKKEGLSKAIKDLDVELNFSTEGIDSNVNFLTGGGYRKENDKLYIFPLGLRDKLSDSTLIHEIGHRYWYKHVPERAKKAWKDKIETQVITVTGDHIRKFFDEYWDKEWGFPYHKEFKKLIKDIKDPTLKIVFTFLEDNRPYYDVKDGRDKKTVYIEHMMKHSKGEQVPLEWISDYGRTDEKEAFAEVFKLWVGGAKGKLGPWTRAFFKEIVRTGGANIKEEELIYKYLVKRV
jgi:hypothetical protein